jgi:hypothetical protein
MSVYLFVILLLLNSASTNNRPNNTFVHGVWTIQDASDSHKRKIIGGVEYNGFSSPMTADNYLQEQHINLIGAPYSPKLKRTVRNALLKWLKGQGHLNAKVDVRTGPMPMPNNKEVTLICTATGLNEQ